VSGASRNHMKHSIAQLARPRKSQEAFLAPTKVLVITLCEKSRTGVAVDSA